MNVLHAALDAKLANLPVNVAIALPSGDWIGQPERAAVRLRCHSAKALAALASGDVGVVAAYVVEGGVDIEGTMRDAMAAAVALMPSDPVTARSSWWSRLLARSRSAALHTLTQDAAQIQFHYDVSDAFYALWLDPRRVYSCAYYAQPDWNLAQAQEAKLDLICRKLYLQAGERFLDVGAGWGGLLLWAAEHYGAQATGITLSRNQHAYVNGLIAQKGLQDRVQMLLMDYRKLQVDQPFDKIASVGMFEHVGRAHMTEYFATLRGLIKPGGVLMNHGITAGGTDNEQLGAGMGDFIEKYIFPGGELLHVSAVQHEMAQAGWEMVDTEICARITPKPYGRGQTRWRLSWTRRCAYSVSKAIRRRLPKRCGRIGCIWRVAQQGLNKVGWHCTKCLRSGQTGWWAAAAFVVHNLCIPLCGTLFIAIHKERSVLYKFVSKAAAEMIMLEPDAERILKIIGKAPSESGIITLEQIPAAIQVLQAAVDADNERKPVAAAQNPDDEDEGDDESVKATVGLKQRAVPFIDMLKRSAAEGVAVIWCN